MEPELEWKAVGVIAVFAVIALIGVWQYRRYQDQAELTQQLHEDCGWLASHSPEEYRRVKYTICYRND